MNPTGLWRIIRKENGVSEDDYYHGVEVGIDIYMDRALKAEATATRLRELLRGLEWSWNDNRLERCPECGGFKEKYERLGKLYKKDIIGHAEDCELAKELADDND